ncbi:MAG: TrmH family RNA methyltransferase [Spirochaetaceae bacterium]|jgi:TrmH family RNA methyltransferase|nr:TrmH family RNA methyltransferase [Spirochaetaceae bacterium]
MISLSKLERLPRHQRLRKILKMICLAEEKRLRVSDAPGKNEAAHDTELVELLIRDPDFSPAAASALREAQSALREAETAPGEDGGSPARRALNTVRHILLAETGRQAADWDFLDTGGKLDPAKRRVFPGMLIYLEDIRSPFNVGAIFRSAESFGVEKIILSPLCADPEHVRARRSGMGCVDLVAWQRSGLDPLTELASTGLPVFALESGGAAPGKFAFPKQGIMLTGSEELGLSGRALDMAGASLGRLTIPTYGAKGSLNVAVAASIALQVWAETLA